VLKSSLIEKSKYTSLLRHFRLKEINDEEK